MWRMRRLGRRVGHRNVGEVVLADGFDGPCVCSIDPISNVLLVCPFSRRMILTDGSYKPNYADSRHRILHEVWLASSVEGCAGLVTGIVVGGLRYSVLSSTSGI